FSASLGPIILNQVAADDPWASELAWSMFGGTCGAAIFQCAFPPAVASAMIRQVVGSCAFAVAFGPTATYYTLKFTSLPTNAYTKVAVSAAVGIAGLPLLIAVGPVAISTITSAVPSAIRRMLGIPEPEH